MFMSSVSLVACCRHMFGFLHCFICWLGRETGYGPADRSVDVLWIVSGAFFSRAVTLSSTVDDVRRVAICGPREIHMVLDHTWTERGKRVTCLSGFPLQGVYRFKLMQLSDMSNHLFVAVTT
jgi:hypothetical protein